MCTLVDVKAQTLVAIDFTGSGLDIAPVLAFAGDAVLHHRAGETPHWRSGEPLPTHWVTFDADRVRNTEIHGAGYRAGFTVHVES